MEGLGVIRVIGGPYGSYTMTHWIDLLLTSYDEWRNGYIKIAGEYLSEMRILGITSLTMPVPKLPRNDVQSAYFQEMLRWVSKNIHANWKLPSSIIHYLSIALGTVNCDGMQIVPKSTEALLPFATDPHTVTAIVMGQDPYPYNRKHPVQNACGYCFAQPPTNPISPSLGNINECLYSSGLGRISCNCLGPWRKQGILLLNACPVYIHGNDSPIVAFEQLTGYALTFIGALRPKTPVVLVGTDAKSFARVASKCEVMAVSHPSTRNTSSAREFVNSHVFRKLNDHMTKQFGFIIDFAADCTEHVNV